MEKCTKYMQKMVADLVGGCFPSLVVIALPVAEGPGGAYPIRTPALGGTLRGTDNS